MKLARHLWLLLLASCVAFAFWLGKTGKAPIIWSRWIRGSPTLECPDFFDLGEREVNSRAIVPFSISNRGRAVLEISEVHTSCACAGLELDDGKDYPRLTSIELSKGETIRVRLKINVTGRPGLPLDIPIVLNSNDPFQRSHRLLFHVPRLKGGAIWEPENLGFGEVPLGTPKTRSLDLFDAASDRRVVERIESTHPDCIVAKFISDTSDSSTARGWHRLGRIEVTIPAKSPGPLNGSVLVFLANEPNRIDRIPVFGEVVPPVTVTPQHIVLPIRTSNGLQEETRCMIRRADNCGFALEVVEKPSEFDVAIQSARSESLVHYVSIRRIPGKNPSKQSLILMRTNHGNQTYDLRLPILWHEEAHHVESSATGLHAH